jgi:hypothetical protein
MPQAVADHGHPQALLVFLFGEYPANQRLDAEHTPEIRGRLAGWDLFGLPIPGQAGVSRLGGGEVGEHRVVAAPLQPLGGRGSVARAAFAAEVVPDQDEPVRVCIREGPDEHRVEGAEHRRHPADAEGQGGDGQPREQGIAAKLAQPVGGVARELLQRRPAPRRARVFRDQSQVAQFAVCRPSGLVLGQSLFFTLGRLLVQVELKLLAQLGFALGPSSQPEQLAKEGAHCAP